MGEPSSSGQTLVETAIVLPCLVLGILMGIQLIIYNHNLIEFLRMTQLEVESKRAETGARLTTYSLFHGLWGPVTLAKTRILEGRALPWRSHRGLFTWKAPGTCVEVHLSARLIPGGGMGSDLTSSTLQSSAQTCYEPSVPKGT